MAKKTYVVKLDGVVVAQRKTDRVYTHAVVVVVDAAAERAHMARPAAEYATQHTPDSYRFIRAMAEAKPDDRVNDWHIATAAGIAEAKIQVGSCYQDYLEWLRLDRMAAYDKANGTGPLSYGALGWCGRLDLAEKLKGGWKMQPFWKALLILPAEEVVK